MSPQQGPAVVILNELEDRYLPVPFDHKGHAQMAQMTRGCVVCHHYTPEGAQHPACRTCHEAEPARADIRKPGLKGAYHRQCMNCHREWSHESSCGICHQPKTGPDETAPTPTKDDIIGQMHPPIPQPGTEIYASRAAAAPGSNVIFRHSEHVHRFGLLCIECHHEDTCLRCHENGRQHVQRVRSLEEHHQPCAACHDVTDSLSCTRCHWEEDQPKPGPFDHASTGWSLERYHGDVECRNCHEAVPFVARDRNCQACHQTWEPGTFDHALTGQTLNETHAALDCESCHVDRRFDQPPACDECHEEDEGITYPARRPGPAPAAQEPATPTPK